MCVKSESVEPNAESQTMSVGWTTGTAMSTDAADVASDSPVHVEPRSYVAARTAGSGGRSRGFGVCGYAL